MRGEKKKRLSSLIVFFHAPWSKQSFFPNYFKINLGCILAAVCPPSAAQKHAACGGVSGNTEWLACWISWGISWNATYSGSYCYFHQWWWEMWWRLQERAASRAPLEQSVEMKWSRLNIYENGENVLVCGRNYLGWIVEWPESLDKQHWPTRYGYHLDFIHCRSDTFETVLVPKWCSNQWFKIKWKF